MNRVELLSPAGNMEVLKYAVSAGADAVYLGGKRFGARKYADNFDEIELVEAIKYCHLYDVKIYVTVNTLIFDYEVSELLDYVGFLYENGVDAVIMQDIGMISLIKQTIKDLEIHASTQMHNHNLDCIKTLKNMGITRAVLARELDIAEINEISEQIDTEIFIHGALCISYSGQCLMSFLSGKRSGNRGECAQACRMSYDLIDKNNTKVSTDGKYLISPKDLNTSEYINQILASNIKSLKIEGRLKSKEYVYLVTKFYRTLIDSYYSAGKIIFDEELLSDIKKEFNRGFTKGFIFKDKDIIGSERPNHKGIYIGDVISVNKNYIEIKLTEELNIKDGIKFDYSDLGFTVNKMSNNGISVLKASKGEIVRLNNDIKLNYKDRVLKTYDISLHDKLNKIEDKKIPIDMKIIAKKNMPLELSINISNELFKEKGVVVEEAKTYPIVKEKIITQISKLGGTPFILRNIDCEIDEDIFISVKEINELRRTLIDRVIESRTKKRILNKIEYNLSIRDFENKDTRFNFLVRNKTQLIHVLNKNLGDIYVTDYSLYQEYKTYPNIFYVSSRTEEKYMDVNKALISDTGGLNYYECGIGNYFLNTTNAYTLGYFHSVGLNRVCLSVELSITQIEGLVKNYNKIYKVNPNIEVLIYGRLEAMVMKYPLIDKSGYALVNNNKKYPILLNWNSTSIMNFEVTDRIDWIEKLKKIGIVNYRIDLFDESESDIDKIIEYKKSSMI